MKRAELIIGKAYYVNESANWREKHYADESYAKTAKGLKFYRVTIVETQLKTDFEKARRTRDVLILNSRNEEKWVALSHIRCEWVEAVKILTEDRRSRTSYDDRGLKYARHLARKQEREVYRPAYAKMIEALKEIEGGYVSGYDRVENAFSIQQINAIVEGLSLLKTQQPQLQSIA
jgi:hypothetical protein